MKYLTWSRQNIERLKAKRGISFEQIAFLIQAGKIIAIEENANRPHQELDVLDIDGYAVIVPFVETDNEFFLKTAFPSRKYTKRYGLKGEL